ncbi:MAG: thioredoxin-dependent thiol peroxidase [Melioribacteraceae bacterium]|nr:thioredoxin-dependent thiol peroxidase [Melioribacteraceae bacterium]MCF8354576.1 thioredoxin-dependent thiol peroxidase [Melioribacteraceae bacterium]MCF8394928.1 thioredoxin-dependent thiol peroxidase [Melioribacteraceae bacterium]MCF8420153.1 thioredoxin-dependent thiol peroxidase [Melioribacteraceae bacterium]
MLAEGKKAPVFTLPNDEGKKISLKDFLGKKVVLYFYPKDNTSGCTQEACDFRDALPGFGKIKAVVLGVSPDSVESHKKFKEKYELPFQLLSDTKKVVLEKYGVWKEKSMYGRKYMGVERTTVVIDENGKIAKIFRKVKVKGHVEQVLETLKGI